MFNPNQNQIIEATTKVHIKPTKSQLKAVIMPSEIKTQFNKLQFKSILLIHLSAMFLMCLIVITGNYFLDDKFLNQGRFYLNKNLNQVITHYFSSSTFLVIAIILIFFWTLVLILNLINLSSLKIDRKRYKISIVNGDSKIPFTITKIYHKTIKKPIIINWLLIPIYLFSGLFIGIIYAINSVYYHFNTEFAWNVKNMATGLAIVLAILFLIHMALLLFLKSSKAKIDAYYGYELMGLEKQIILKQQTNKRCLIIFLLLLIPLTIIWILIRKVRNKPIFFNWS